MRAQRARDTVESYEGERPFVHSPIRGEESSGHEPHVRMKYIRSGCAGSGIRTHSAQVEIRLTDKTVEIKDRRRVATIGFDVGVLVVGGRKRSIGMTRKEKVSSAPGVEMRNRIRRATRARLLAWVAACRNQKTGAQRDAGRGGCISNESPSRDDVERVIRSCPREPGNRDASHGLLLF